MRTENVPFGCALVRAHSIEMIGSQACEEPKSTLCDSLLGVVIRERVERRGAERNGGTGGREAWPCFPWGDLVSCTHRKE